ncbi:unnamed protein product, partial [Candidula unifasciata]
MSSVYILRILVAFQGCLCLAGAYLNLYLSTQETYRLLGVHYELFYVRNGIINQYALSFDLPLQSHIDDIFFTWQSLRDEPQMFYKMSFNVSNSRAMSMPTANISLNGEVPNQISVFRVTLPCTGQINAEVHISIQMSISILSVSNPTLLNFKRKKVCLKKNSVWMSKDKDDNSMWLPNDKDLLNQYQLKFSNATFSLSPDDDSKEKDDLTTSTHIFYAAVACTCAVIILIALGVVAYYLNTQRTSDHYTKKINC